jgi:hypothetical protein
MKGFQGLAAAMAGLGPITDSADDHAILQGLECYYRLLGTGEDSGARRVLFDLQERFGVEEIDACEARYLTRAGWRKAWSNPSTISKVEGVPPRMLATYTWLPPRHEDEA